MMSRLHSLRIPVAFSFLTASILLVGACSSPCDDALLANTIVGTGDASLVANIVEQEGPGRSGKAISCVKVFVIASESYADTLFNEEVRVSDNKIFLQGFQSNTVDIIIDRSGFFPVKYTDVALQPGVNQLKERVLMYRSDIPFTIPGEFGISLREEASLEEIKPLYSTIDGITVEPAPGGEYVLKIPFRGTKLTRERVESVCRKMVYSRFITDARPIVNLSTIVPGL